MKNLVLIVFLVFLVGGCSESQRSENNIDENIIRKAAVIKVKPDKLDLYKKLHAEPWENVNKKLKECNIQNYSIYYRGGYLFSYLEYTGNNWSDDMEKLASDSTIQAWWKLTDPCQEPADFADEGEWWADMEEVFHLN